ncbi:MAG: hypothetical protein AB7T59_08570 [Hyphomonadaceae bacterium]
MRTVLAAILFLAACSGVAQSETRYDLYIYHARGGDADIYLFSGGQDAVAVEVRGCGDVRLLPDAGAVTSQVAALRSTPGASVVTVVARGSRTELGPCGAHEEEEALGRIDDEDSLVVIESASARQMRAMIRSFDAAPPDLRGQIIASLGLD